MGKIFKDNFHNLFNEIHQFFDTTTVHGFFYLNHKNAATRLLWAFLLLVSLGTASKMIQETLQNADRNPIITTMDTINIREVPFPAITFYPGGFRNELALLRRFYDYTDIERYDKNAPMWHNSDFRKCWKFVLTQKIHVNKGKKSTWISNLIEKTVVYLQNKNKTNFVHNINKERHHNSTEKPKLHSEMIKNLSTCFDMIF